MCIDLTPTTGAIALPSLLLLQILKPLQQVNNNKEELRVEERNPEEIEKEKE